MKYLVIATALVGLSALTASAQPNGSWKNYQDSYNSADSYSGPDAGIALQERRERQAGFPTH